MCVPCPMSLWDSDLTPKAALIFRAQSVTDPKTHYISKAPTLWGPKICNQHTLPLFRKNFKRTCCIYFHGVAGVQWKWAHFLRPTVGSYSIYSSSDTCNSTTIYSLRQLNILTASPKENLPIVQKMSLVNSKIKYPDHEPDCTQAYRVDRIK